MLTTLITIPTTSGMLALAGDAGRPLFEELMPIGLLVAGLLVGASLALWFINTITGIITNFTSSERWKKTRYKARHGTLEGFYDD